MFSMSFNLLPADNTAVSAHAVQGMRGHDTREDAWAMRDDYKCDFFIELFG